MKTSQPRQGGSSRHRPKIHVVETLEKRALLSGDLFGGRVFQYSTNQQSPSSPGIPDATVSADFNHDGKPDLAVVTNPYTYTLQIFLNNGDGAFPAPASYNVGAGASAIATADFNGDGLPDLVVANSTNNTVEIFMNTGAGLFSSGTIYSVGSDPVCVTAADFNGDGFPDLAVADYGSNQVSVLINQGSGTFGSATNFAAGTNPQGVTAADFNGDGKRDIAIADSGVTSNNVRVLLNLGSNTFSSGTLYTAGTAPYSIGSADLNGDGKPDLVVGDLTSSGSNISVFLNTGTGTFPTTSTNYAVVSQPAAIAFADLNGDGKLDIAVGNRFKDQLSILLNKGPGTFSTPVNYLEGALSNVDCLGIAAADFNGDGRIDLAVNAANTNTFTILLNQGNGTYPATPPSYSAVTAPSSIATADLSGDGKSDLVVANNQYFGTVSVLMNNGAGGFLAPVSYTVDANPVDVVAADLNGDGHPDIIVSDQYGSTNEGLLDVLINKGDGTFLAPVRYFFNFATTQLVVADLNGDGKPDIAVGVTGNVDHLAILMNNGDGTFGAPTYYVPSAAVTSIATADFNGDGKPDFVTGNIYGQSIQVLLNQGGGNFSSGTTYSISSSAIGAVIAADLNGDGKPDIAVAEGLSNGSSLVGGVAVLLNDGTGKFGAVVTYAAGWNPSSLSVADFNGDGIPDLITLPQAGTASVLLGLGDGTFAAPQTYVVCTPGASWAVVGDFNSDGKPDLAALGNNVSVLLNQRTTAFLSLSGNTLTVSAAIAGGPVSITATAGQYVVSAANGTYDFAGSAVSAIHFNGTTASDTLSIYGSVSAPLTFSGDGGADQINITAGASLNLASDPGSFTVVNNSGTLGFSAGTPGAGFNTIHLSSLALSNTSTATLVNPTSGSDRTLLVVASLAIAPGGQLDLGQNDLDVTQMSFASINSLVQSGYGGGTWNGTGIASSKVASNSSHLTALSVIQNNQGGPLFSSSRLFDGIVPAATDVLVKYTYVGDANVSGNIDGSDYSQIDNGYLQHLTGWFDGDFNYDGVVNGSDYTLIDNAFNTQGASLAASIAPPKTSIAAEMTSWSATHSAVAVSNRGPVRPDIGRKAIGRSRTVSYAPDIFSTETPIDLGESTEQRVELSIQKRDLLDQLSFAQ